MSKQATRSTVQQVVGLVVAIFICFAAAGLGAAVTTSEISGWYRGITKPTWNPPDWIFGPVWSTLYLLMAIAVWLIWRKGSWRETAIPLTFFGGQLLLNIAWSWIFFGLHQPGWAFAEILLLWLAILGTLLSFWRRSVWAGGLLLPYLAWVSFAAVLNFVIWQLNPLV